MPLLLGGGAAVALATVVQAPLGTALAVSALLAGTAASVLVMRRRLLRPLALLADRAERICAGEELLRIPSARDPRIRTISTAINATLTRLTNAKAQIADGDIEAAYLRREVELKNRLQGANRSLERRVRDLGVLFEAARTVSSTLHLRELLENTCATVGQAMGSIEVMVFLYEPEHESLDLAAAYGLPAGEHARVKDLSFRLDEGVVGPVLRDLRPTVSAEAADAPGYTSFKGRRELSGPLACFPLAFGGVRLGVVSFVRPGGAPFEPETVALFEAISNLVVAAIRNARLFERTRTLAIRDELTGLFNRRLLLNRLEAEWERSRRFGDPLSLILLDIDLFKKLNDSHGHLVGDEVLRKMGDVLSLSIRRTDTVGRYGGEEFLAILPRTSEDQAAGVAEKIRSNVERAHFVVPDLVSVSCGVACTSADPGERSADLLALADAMLYRAKRRGRNRVECYGDSGEASGGASGK